MKKMSVLLLAMLALAIPAVAENKIGERTYGSYRDIRITENSTASEALDWLDDFCYYELAAVQNMTKELTDYSELIEQNEELLQSMEDITLRQYVELYFDDEGQNGDWKQTLVRQNTRSVADLYTRFTFHERRLTDLIARDASLRDSIRSGLLSDDEMQKMYAELQQTDAALETSRLEAIAFIQGSETNGQAPEQTVAIIMDELDSLDDQNANMNRLDAVQTLGAYLESMNMQAMSEKEKQPEIYIVSTRQFGFTFTTYDESVHHNVGVPGIEVTVTNGNDRSKP